MKIQHFAAALTLLFSPSAFAQNFLGGTVYQIVTDGVYLNTPNGLTFMPSNTSFRIGNMPVALPNLTPGAQLNAYYPQGWVPQYVPQQYYVEHRNVPWGQQVKTYQMEKNSWKKGGKSNGKGKGKNK